MRKNIYDVGIGNGKDFPLLKIKERNSFDVVRGHYFFGLHRYVDRPFKYITFLRDPLDRVISLYNHDKKAPGSVHHVEANSLDLYSFCEQGVYKDELNNGQVRRLSGVNPEFSECEDWMLEKAIENIDKHFAAVGLVERYDESLWMLHDVLSWKFPPVYHKAMVNKERGRPDVSIKTKALIEELNVLDRKLYDYISDTIRPCVDAPSMKKRCAYLNVLNQISRPLINLKRRLR
jgi:hypothetical protein